jgi:hypothetical protein
MRAAAVFSSLVFIGVFLAEPLLSQEILVFPGANSRETYFTVHNIRPAHALSQGVGTKVGILDHSFGMDAHPELYAGGENFQSGEWGDSFRGQSHHGYWMALVLREIAPATEIYALNTYSSDEGERVEAMVRAIDWAIQHDLDAITYSAGAFSPGARAVLDPAVDRAVDAGVAVVFIHYPHPRNIFPSGIGPRAGDDEREPDLNIFHYDYTVVFAEQYVAFMDQDDDARQGYRPFLSISSTAPVTAGFVALLLSVDPTLTPADCKRILMEASRPMSFEGRQGIRVPDVFEAVRSVWAAGR